ncbi:hypothetical protein NLI96_g6462 [Meripilus lineatus]|uniref:DUF6533 domain-containing protein n=1 Tax=Meripilus lineatus TaxID=2056292 RepID=A0AAD5YFX4_9APHY|nr:hypothetical protein NLI96_g6462 [Physisporinus lineatus]
MDGLEAYYSNLQGVRFSRVALLALFVYEMLITIDQEIEAIWKRRFALPSLLYLLMRFGTLGFLILYAQGPLSFLGPPSLVVSLRCKVEIYLLQGLITMVMFAVSVFNVFRVWAIWGQHWLLAVIILVLSAVPFCLDMNLNAHITDIQIVEDALEPLGDCGYEVALSDRLSLMLARYPGAKRSRLTNRLGLDTYNLKKLSQQLGIKADVTTLLLRDGTLYFGCVNVGTSEMALTHLGSEYSVQLALNIVMTITTYTMDLSPAPVYESAFSAILYTRFILNLRSVDIADTNGSAPASSIYFANVMGNIGTALEHSVEASGERSHASIRQQIENPLSIGILEEVQENNERDSEGAIGTDPDLAPGTDESA